MRPRAGLEADTGDMEASAVGLGGYYTRSAKEGAYLDLVGQAAVLRNEFHDRYGEDPTQKGWRAGLSAEGGYPLLNWGKNWSLEGQAQLSYLYTHYQSFQDRVSKVDSYGTDRLRGRLGLRLVWDVRTGLNQSAQCYGRLNLVHDFLEPESVTVGAGAERVDVDEDYEKTWAEAGVGVQGWVTERASLFGEARYQRGLEGEREGLSLNLGLRVTF